MLAINPFSLLPVLLKRSFVLEQEAGDKRIGNSLKNENAPNILSRKDLHFNWHQT